MSAHIAETRTRALVAVVFLLVMTALYEAAIALRIIPMGKDPGAGPAGERIVLWLSLLVMFISSAISLSYVLGRSTGWRSVAALAAPAAATFVVARFYSFDPYYLPTLRRMSDGGNVAGSWIVALVAMALLAGLVTRILPRIGVAMTSIALLVCAVTAIGVGIGH